MEQNEDKETKDEHFFFRLKRLAFADVRVLGI